MSSEPQTYSTVATGFMNHRTATNNNLYSTTLYGNVRVLKPQVSNELRKLQTDVNFSKRDTSKL